MLWPAFYSDILPFVLGCPIPMVDAALLSSSQEFFRKTRAWRQWLDPVITSIGSRDYDFDIPTGSEIVRVEKCTINKQDVDVLSHNEQNLNYSTDELPGAGIVSRDRLSFSTAKQAAAGSVIEIEASLMPSKRANGIPDELFVHFAEAICCGAKHRLMLMPKTLFYQPDLSAALKTQFDSEISTATVNAWRGFTGRTPRARLNLV